MSYAIASSTTRSKTSTGLFGMHHHLALKAKATPRKPCVGSWLMLPGHYNARVAASAGYDWILIDLEHGALSDMEMHQSIQSILSEPGCSPLVRIPANENWMVKRALDAGAHGLLVPLMNTAEDARKLVSYTRFPVPKSLGGPQGGGIRGIGSPFSPLAWRTDLKDYFLHANKEIFVTVQIETRQGLENCEAIAQVEGIDALLIGPNDLASSMGYISTEHESEPEVQLAIERVLQACKKAGKYAGMFCTTPEGVRKRFEQGFDFMNLGGDVLSISNWNRNARDQIKDLL